MCLESVRDRIEPSTMIQSGWKTFTGNASHPHFEKFNLGVSREVPLDKWIEAEGKEIKISTFKKYDAGFHIYEDEQEMKWKGNKRRVYYRNVHTRGVQDGLTIVIAREMFVPSDPDDWPPKG